MKKVNWKIIITYFFEILLKTLKTKGKAKNKQV